MNAKGSHTKVASGKSEVIAAMPLTCSDETLAVEFFERTRWAEAPACVHCGSVSVYKMTDRKTGHRNRRFLWRCKDCNKQFTVRVGTILEDSPIPLRHWAYAFWAACAGKKGVSALEIQRQTGLTYKSALFLMHRIRWAMSDEGGPAPRLLKGIVEVDETYCGGRHRRKQRQFGYVDEKKRGRGTDKAPVFAMVERNGEVRTEHVVNITAKNLKAHMEANIDPSAYIMSDEFGSYRTGAKGFAGHATVMHSVREYARGEVSTNTIEGFFSLLKRKLYGTHHAVSKKHLSRYLDEAAFIYNTRGLDDGDRIALAIKRGDGKRLTYRQQVGPRPAA
jgi:transposase-like protein